MKSQTIPLILTNQSLDNLEDIIFDILLYISKDCKYARLILEEWLTNIIKYGQNKKNETLIIINNETSITIIDKGIPFNITEYPKKDMDVWKIGGKGIFLIRELSSSLIYEYKNNSNNLTIQF